MEEKYNNKRNVIFNPNKVQKWNEEENKVISVNAEFVDMLSMPFAYLRKSAGDGYSDFKELEEAKSIAKKDRLVRIKKLNNEKNAGYALVVVLTVGGALISGFIIFTVIGNMVR